MTRSQSWRNGTRLYPALEWATWLPRWYGARIAVLFWCGSGHPTFMRSRVCFVHTLLFLCLEPPTTLARHVKWKVSHFLGAASLYVETLFSADSLRITFGCGINTSPSVEKRGEYLPMQGSLSVQLLFLLGLGSCQSWFEPTTQTEMVITWCTEKCWNWYSMSRGSHSVVALDDVVLWVLTRITIL